MQPHSIINGLSKQNKMLRQICLLTVLLAAASGHMRMLDPPGRPSLWRFEEYGYLNPVIIGNDDEMWCDNIRQNVVDNRCGICGDPVAQPSPRDYEYGGRHWRDVVVRNYTAGQMVQLHLQSYAPHGGGLEIQLCNRVPETEDCFQTLMLSNGDTMWEMSLGGGDFELHFGAQLPAGVTCDRCVLRFHWRGAQNWGTCENPPSRICDCDYNSGNPPGGHGCGEQQTFRTCSDISIH